jgi:hypothetical protein
MRSVPHITKKNRVLFEDSLRRIKSNYEILRDMGLQPVIHNVDKQRFVFLNKDDVSAYMRVVEAALDWQRR